jgi:hypothetical protein
VTSQVVLWIASFLTILGYLPFVLENLQDFMPCFQLDHNFLEGRAGA